jgi:DNA-binding transcriptional LysR family regulator
VPEPFVVAFVVGVTPGKWARVWAERLPEHPLDLRPMSPDEALVGLEDGTLDAAFLRLPVTDEALSAIPLYEEQPVVVVPKDHAIEALDVVTLADLVAETVLDQDWASAVELVAANVGVAVMPQSVARALSRKDVVARPVTDAATTRIALVWPLDRTTALVDEFIGIVRGRTAQSSRGTPTPPTEKPAPPKRKPTPAAKNAAKGTAKKKPRQQRFKRR